MMKERIFVRAIRTCPPTSQTKGNYSNSRLHKPPDQPPLCFCLACLSCLIGTPHPVCHITMLGLGVAFHCLGGYFSFNLAASVTTAIICPGSTPSQIQLGTAHVSSVAIRLLFSVETLIFSKLLWSEPGSSEDWCPERSIQSTKECTSQVTMKSPPIYSWCHSKNPCLG